MIVDCAHYREGRRQDTGTIPLDEAAARCGEGGFVWLGLFEPDADQLEQVRVRFGLHELAVEDAQTYHLRPKVEHYEEDVTFVILRTARYDDAREEVEFGEISVFVGSTFVITVRQGVASELHGARLRLEQPTERIYALRREVTDFFRAVHPLLAPLEAGERGGLPDVGPELRPYFRDVRDHLRLVNEEVTAQRDLLTTCLEANMAVISVEQTRVSVSQTAAMKQLTIIATVFLPLTFVTGFFGQNFGWLVDHIESGWSFAAFGLGGLLLPCIALLVWFRRSDAV